MTEKEEKTLDKFGKFVQDENASNEFLVEIIKLAGGFLNLRTISDYAKDEVKFIIDNH